MLQCSERALDGLAWWLHSSFHHRFQKAACYPASRNTAQEHHTASGWSQACTLPSPWCLLPPHTWQSHTAVSQLQVLQVSPAGANFHFNIQFHWEFDGVFHLVFHDLSDLEENIRHQTHTELQCSRFLSIDGADKHLESYPAFICTDLPPVGMQPNPD